MRSLRALTIGFLLIFSAATGLTGYTTYNAAHRTIAALVDRRIQAVADALLDDIPAGAAVLLLARIERLSGRRDTGDIGFELVTAAGRRLGGNVALSRRLPLGFTTLHGNDRIVGLTAGRALVRDAGGGLRLIVVAETEPVDGYAPARLRNAVLGFGSIAVVVLGGTALFGFLVHRRIGEVRGAAEAIVAGDLTRRVPVPSGGGAFAAQALAFNRMLDRIGDLMASLRHVGSDVAHDLRTPLARLRGGLALLAEEAETPARAARMEEAVEQCDALLAMFAAVLRIAEVEGGERRAAFTLVDVSAIAREVIDSLGPVVEQRDLSLHATSATIVLGDRQLLLQALYNMVENALHHTPPGSRVAVSVGVADNRAMVRVDDDGPGIAEHDRPRALRRFGRLDASRHRPGYGLGLPLVDAVARLHGSVLTLADARPGLAASFSIPLASAGPIAPDRPRPVPYMRIDASSP